MYFIARPSSASSRLLHLMAVRISRFCRFLFLAKSPPCSTSFSSSDSSSSGRSACMNALTVFDTISGSFVSGSAVPLTWSITLRRCGLSVVSTRAHSSSSWRSTR